MARPPKALSEQPPDAVAAQPTWRPLADRMRPVTLSEVAGQGHLLASGQPLFRLLKGELHSAILWGPPGSGKTTLARLLATTVGAHFVALSAVLAGVKEVREAVAYAQAHPEQPTLLFLDEVHRFNKAQQDAFLPYVEDGTLIFVGDHGESGLRAEQRAAVQGAGVRTEVPVRF